jgi:hypothetical protein
MLTTLAHPCVKNLGQNFVRPRSRNWVVLDELDRATELADKSNGLYLGNFGHDAGFNLNKSFQALLKRCELRAEHIDKRTALLCC